MGAYTQKVRSNVPVAFNDGTCRCEDAIGGRAMIVYKDIKITAALASQIG
jgi:hypothetical protein